VIVLNELIKINIEYLNNLSENRLSMHDRADKGLKFPNVEAYEYLSGSMMMEILSQHFEYILVQHGENNKTASDEFIGSVESKIEFILRKRRNELDLN